MRLRDARKRVLNDAPAGGGGDLMSAIASRMAARRGSIELMQHDSDESSDSDWDD